MDGINGIYKSLEAFGADGDETISQVPHYALTSGVPHEGTSGFAEPFDIAGLTGTLITLTACWFRNGPVSKFTAGDKTADLTGLTGDNIVAAVIDTNDLSVTLAVDSSSSGDGSVYDLTLPNDGYFRIPLWLITRATTDNGWSVVRDLRKMINVGAYV